TTIPLCDLDRFVDGRPYRNIVPKAQFIQRDSQHVAIHSRQLLDRKLWCCPGYFGINGRKVITDTFDQDAQVLAEWLLCAGSRKIPLQHLIQFTWRYIGLKEDLKRSGSCSMSCCRTGHGSYNLVHRTLATIHPACRHERRCPNPP